MRTIKVKLTTSAKPVSINTNATYLKEFKQEPSVRALNLNWDSIKLIDKDSKLSLELDDSLLPAGDGYLFCFPIKTKSGMNYSDMSYGQLRKLCADRLPKGSISATPTKMEMIRTLNETPEFRNIEEPEQTPVNEIFEESKKDVILYEIVTSETLTEEYKSIEEQLN